MKKLKSINARPISNLARGPRPSASIDRAIAASIMHKIEHISPDELNPNPKNPRMHSKQQVKLIARSIQAFGFNNPILVDRDGEIVAGHGRLQAAQSLKLQTVPVLRLDHLSKAEVDAYMIADNRLAERASWDNGLLSFHFEQLKGMDFEVELTGFDSPEIEMILGETAEGSTSEVVEDVPPPYDGTLAIASLGDVFGIGDHKLICADARDPKAYRELLGREKASIVFTDPPYNVPIAGHVSGLGRIQHREFAMASGELTELEFTDFLTSVFALSAQHSADGSIHFVCMDWRHMREMLEAGHAAYDELKQLCVWAKTSGGMGSFYRSRHELIFVWKHGRASHINNFGLGQYGRSRTNVWDYAGMSSFGHGRSEQLALHPTCKPVGLIADAIKDCSNQNQIVLDPFGGSGSTLMAAEQTHRRARLVEIDPHYCDVIIRRWQNQTGLAAVHAGTGKTFDQLAARQPGE